MSNEKEEVWTMPPVKPADRVYVGKQPAQVKDPDLRLIGFVTRVGSETVDIVTFAPGANRARGWDNCRHVDDPVLVSTPSLMQEDYFAVWEWAEPELSRVDRESRQMTHQEWERLAADLKLTNRRLDLLENRVAELRKPPRRGRPPKQTTPQPVSSDV